MHERGAFRRFALVAVVGGLAACSHQGSATRVVAAQSTPTPAPRTAASSLTTASAVVTAYYDAVGRHDESAAAALLDPQLRAQGTDATNIVRLTNLRDLRLAPASLPLGLATGYADITQAFVTYDVVYRQQLGSPNGANSRFLYLGRDAATGQWRILSIGTGP